jgi:hypothetical protein
MRVFPEPDVGLDELRPSGWAVEADKIHRALVPAEKGERFPAGPPYGVVGVEMHGRLAFAGGVFEQAGIAENVAEREMRPGRVGAAAHEVRGSFERAAEVPALGLEENDVRGGVCKLRVDRERPRIG